jgi:hypothetical protein
MNPVVLTLRFDTLPVMAALGDLQALHAALAHRHGEQYRALDRRIEAVIVAIVPADFAATELGAGEFVLTAPEAVTAILRDARALGLIA